MPPKAVLPSVELIIPSDRFFSVMNDIGKWLTGHQVTSPYSTSRQDCNGKHKLCFAFPQARDAANFAQQFDGQLVT
jgi:hypothetical protein